MCCCDPEPLTALKGDLLSVLDRNARSWMTHRDGVTEMFVPGFQYESVAEKLSVNKLHFEVLKIQLKFKYNGVQNQSDSRTYWKK